MTETSGSCAEEGSAEKDSAEEACVEGVTVLPVRRFKDEGFREFDASVKPASSRVLFSEA